MLCAEKRRNVFGSQQPHIVSYFGQPVGLTLGYTDILHGLAERLHFLHRRH